MQDWARARGIDVSYPSEAVDDAESEAAASRMSNDQLWYAGAFEIFADMIKTLTLAKDSVCAEPKDTPVQREIERRTVQSRKKGYDALIEDIQEDIVTLKKNCRDGIPARVEHDRLRVEYWREFQGLQHIVYDVKRVHNEDAVNYVSHRMRAESEVDLDEEKNIADVVKAADAEEEDAGCCELNRLGARQVRFRLTELEPKKQDDLLPGLNRLAARLAALEILGSREE